MDTMVYVGFCSAPAGAVSSILVTPLSTAFFLENCASIGYRTELIDSTSRFRGGFAEQVIHPPPTIIDPKNDFLVAVAHDERLESGRFKVAYRSTFFDL